MSHKNMLDGITMALVSSVMLVNGINARIGSTFYRLPAAILCEWVSNAQNFYLHPILLCATRMPSVFAAIVSAMPIRSLHRVLLSTFLVFVQL